MRLEKTSCKHCHLYSLWPSVSLSLTNSLLFAQKSPQLFSIALRLSSLFYKFHQLFFGYSKALLSPLQFPQLVNICPSLFFFLIYTWTCGFRNSQICEKKIHLWKLANVTFYGKSMSTYIHTRQTLQQPDKCGACSG